MRWRPPRPWRAPRPSPRRRPSSPRCGRSEDSPRRAARAPPRRWSRRAGRRTGSIHPPPICPNASISPVATSSQRVIPPKMLNSTALTLSSDRITSNRACDRLGARAAAGVEEIGRLAPASATTSSVDIERPAPLARIPMSPSSLTYVSPRSLAIRSCGSSLEGSRSSAFSAWRNSELSSSVTIRVERLDVALRGDDQRIDLDERRLLGQEHLVELREHRADRAYHVRVDAGLVGQPPALEILEPDQRVDVQARDRIRVLVGDLLDVHPALRREQQQRGLRRAVEDD